MTKKLQGLSNRTAILSKHEQLLLARLEELKSISQEDALTKRSLNAVDSNNITDVEVTERFCKALYIRTALEEHEVLLLKRL